MFVSVVDYRSPNAAAEFTESLHRSGFGVLKNHPIPQDLVETLYAEWLAFFNSEEKFGYSFDPEKQDGYFSTQISETAKGAQIKDIKEYFHIYPWGRIPEALKPNAMRYYDLANQLASELLGWIETWAPAEVKAKLSEPLPKMIEGTPNTLLRVLRYPPLTGNEPPGALRAAAHEDINLITVLPAANEPGLQVKDRDGNWQDVPCDFGTLVINIGDMLQEATGGYYPSTSHRVVNPTGEGAFKSRVSLPLFLHARSEVVLSERYTARQYLDERLRELGVKM
ncbi:isopenicillin N synthase family dioxygenase [Parachitinimonas caeni]|uniref:2-oxoglutarate-dependent ethylene/succinate-forming enzyme n=1 Tax=Parachitinimonas caeni TaxID=3031301 RepID=A0ABT7DR08_9NEIS|nr:2OG-Fe(II) oxygenase family protein [Parachitinimonas caeni]MDK2122509.1 2OG-Fe(II) oxygenase family protein [Parachitinimonas caeni]